MFDYKNRVVVMTGASSGLGKQMARGFAQMGANLVLMARRIERLEDFAQELAPFLAKVEFALNSSDPLLRGLAIWAFTRLKYQPAAGIIGSLVEDSEEFYLFSDDCLQKTTVGEMAKKYLQELK